MSTGDLTLSSLGLDIDPAVDASVSATLAAVEEELRANVASADPLVAEAARHLADAGGKRFRPLLVALGAQFGDPAAPEVVAAANVVELTHLATLYHDDVMDEAEVRRGAPSANARWGNSVAILVGDYLFARAADIAASLGPEAVHLQARTFARLVHGQIAETVGSARQRPDRALPARHHGEDGVADRDVGPVRRPVLRRAAASVSRRSPGMARRSASRSSSPTTCSTSRPSRCSRARRPAPICARACRHCRCSMRWPATTPTRPRCACASCCASGPITDDDAARRGAGAAARVGGDEAGAGDGPHLCRGGAGPARAAAGRRAEAGDGGALRLHRRPHELSRRTS